MSLESAMLHVWPEPARLRELRIYGGAQGIWVDKQATLEVDGGGVAVGLLHAGVAYADDFADDGVIYPYPSTRRGGGRDASEVDATKAAGRLELPVFVITHPVEHPRLRGVYLGWVEGWDDRTRLVLVTFSQTAPSQTTPNTTADDDGPFALTEPIRGKTRQVKARQGQQRF